MSGAEIDVLGNCPVCLLEIGTNPNCENCQLLWENVNRCPCCGEPLFAYQEWQRRADREGYVHAWCDDRLNLALVADVGGEADE